MRQAARCGFWLLVLVAGGCASGSGGADGTTDDGDDGICDPASCDSECQVDGAPGGICQEDGACVCVGEGTDTGTAPGDSDPQDSDTGDSDPATESASDSESESNSDEATDDTDSDTGSASETDSGSESESEADTGSDTTLDLLGLKLFFWEHASYLTLYEGHELWVGPATSVDPADGSWTRLSGAAQMKPVDSGEWVLGTVVSLEPYAGTSVRLAFRYLGSIADDWYLDDLCVEEQAGVTPPGSCTVAEIDFDDAVAPALPADWQSVPGPGDMAGAAWATVTDPARSGANGVGIEGGTGQHDVFLVSAALTLP